MGAYSELSIENDALSTGEDLSGFSMEEEPVTFDPPAAQPQGTPAAQAAVSAAAPVSSESVGTAGASAGDKDQAAAEDEDAKRKAHEAAEAKRKAEIDARQAAKKAAQEEQLAKVAAMSDEEVMAASMKRVSTDTEKLTRRNMKECVAEYIQTKCIEDPAFARKSMHPCKSMIRCFQYISRKAWDYVQDELKANGIRPGPGQQAYGADVPDDLCYQWAVDYFNDPDVKEDHEDEEEFVPKPYNGRSTASRTASKAKGKDKKATEKKAAEKKAAEKKAAEKPKTESAPKPKPKDDDGQMSLLGMAS